jgi:transglutaminase-like putative cysteine protease
MRYRVVHRTEYEYDDEVSASYGRAHLRPRDGVRQRCLHTELAIDPVPAELRDHVDFFGNVSSYFAVRELHTRLRVLATSDVEIMRPEQDEDLSRSWEHVRDGLARNDHARAYLLASPLVHMTPEVRRYAEAAFPAGRPIGEALRELAAGIYRDFDYVAGSTTVRTTLPEVLRKRRGVCQDFAHLAVGCLRAMGLAARYVSGYLETEPPPGRPKLTGADASHAWASVLVPGHGWVDVDPTNNQFVDERYVVAARGRDYGDVPPLKGVIVTDAKTSTMTVGVDVIRVPS